MFPWSLFEHGAGNCKKGYWVNLVTNVFYNIWQSSYRLLFLNFNQSPAFATPISRLHHLCTSFGFTSLSTGRYNEFEAPSCTAHEISYVRKRQQLILLLFTSHCMLPTEALGSSISSLFRISCFFFCCCCWPFFFRFDILNYGEHHGADGC